METTSYGQTIIEVRADELKCGSVLYFPAVDGAAFYGSGSLRAYHEPERMYWVKSTEEKKVGKYVWVFVRCTQTSHKGAGKTVTKKFGKSKKVKVLDR